jgi:hypothetical protein
VVIVAELGGVKNDNIDNGSVAAAVFPIGVAPGPFSPADLLVTGEESLPAACATKDSDLRGSATATETTIRAPMKSKRLDLFATRRNKLVVFIVNTLLLRKYCRILMDLTNSDMSITA